jgi:hypothetical protein
MNVGLFENFKNMANTRHFFVYIKPRSKHLFSSVPTQHLLRSLSLMVVVIGGGAVKVEKRKATLSGKQCSFWALNTELNRHSHTGALEV